MDTAMIGILFSYMVILAGALTVITLTISYLLRLPSSKRARELAVETEREPKQSVRKSKVELRPTSEGRFTRFIRRRALHETERASRMDSPTQLAMPGLLRAKSSALATVVRWWSVIRSIKLIRLSDHRGYEGAQLKEPALQESSKPPTEPEDESVDDVLPTDEPDVTSADTDMLRQQETTQEPSQGKEGPTAEEATPTRTPEAVHTKDETEAEMDTGAESEVKQETSDPMPVSPASSGEREEQSQSTETSSLTSESDTSEGAEPAADQEQPGAERPAAEMDSDETDEETPDAEKQSMGDLSDLFARSSSEDTQSNKLADEVEDVDVSEILQKGMELLDRLKRSDR